MEDGKFYESGAVRRIEKQPVYGIFHRQAAFLRYRVPFRGKMVYDRMEVMIRGHVVVCPFRADE